MLNEKRTTPSEEHTAREGAERRRIEALLRSTLGCDVSRRIAIPCGIGQDVHVVNRAVLRGRKRDDPVDAVTHGSGEALAVGDVMRPRARHDRDVLDREGQIGVAGPLQVNAIRPPHAGGEPLRRLLHAGVVERADVEVEVLERLGVHLRKLGHARPGPPENAPSRVVHALLEVHGALVEPGAHLHLLGRDPG